MTDPVPSKDLVSRLREQSTYLFPKAADTLMEQAADEIERLQQVVDDCNHIIELQAKRLNGGKLPERAPLATAEPAAVRGVDLVTERDRGYAEGYSDSIRWQAIETAPVQMEPILLTDGKWFAAGHVDLDGIRKFPIYHFAVSQEYDWTPTHWMPLPAAPSLAATECPRSPDFGEPVPMDECIDNEKCTCRAAQPPRDGQ